VRHPHGAGAEDARLPPGDGPGTPRRGDPRLPDVPPTGVEARSVGRRSHEQPDALQDAGQGEGLRNAPMPPCVRVSMARGPRQRRRASSRDGTREHPNHDDLREAHGSARTQRSGPPVEAEGATSLAVAVDSGPWVEIVLPGASYCPAAVRCCRDDDALDLPACRFKRTQQGTQARKADCVTRYAPVAQTDRAAVS
jgi:hypothetical protein